MLDGFALHEIICDAVGAPVDYRFLAVNPAFERMTGFKAAQLIGHTVLEVMPGTERHWIDTYGRVALSGEPALFENYASELKKYFKVTAFQPTPGQFACIFVEITENKLTEKALKKSQLLLQSSIESPKDMIILSIDRQYRYLYFNSYHKEVMKAVYGKDVGLGMNLLECITNDDDRIRAKINYDRALAGERHSTIEEYGDLSRQFYETRYNPIINDGNEIIGATAFSANVSERMRSEAAMSESEARFRTLATLLPVGIYLTDVQGRCRYANPRWLRMAGLTLEEALGDGWKQGLHPDDREAVFAAWNKTVAAEGGWGLEYRFRTKEGAVTWVQGLAAPQRDAQGRTIGYVGANIDITTSKRAEEELRAGEERMRAIVEGTPHLFFYVQDVEASTVYVSPTIETITGYPPDVWMKRRDWFVTDAACNREARALTHAHLRGEGAGQPVRLEIRHAQGHPILLEAYEYPLRRGDRVVGLQGVAHDITERIRAEEALRATEDRLRLLFENSPDGIVVIDPESMRFLEFNDTACRQLGYSREDFARLSLADIEVRETRDEIRAHIGRVIREGASDFETEHRAKDGSRRRVRVIARYTERHGRSLYHCIFQDVTERRLAEEALRESEQRFRAVVDHSPYAILLTAPDGSIFSANAAAERLFGRSAEEIVRIGRGGVIDASDPRLAPALAERARSGRFLGELTFIRANGEKFPAEVSSNLFRDGEGRERTSMVIRDVSEGRRTELALRESEERLRGVLFSMADWVWEVDENGIYTYSSGQGTGLLGYAREEIIGRTPFEFMPPGEAERVRAAFAGFVSRQEAFKDLENWNLKKTGERICLLTSGVPIVDEAGRFRGYRGVDKDITDRKKAEEALQNALRFQQALMEAIPSPVFYKDAGMRYIGGNKAFEDYIGMPRERFSGRTVHDISPGDLAERYDQADRELLEKGGAQTYEAAVARAGGERRDVAFHKAVFADSEGRPAGIIGVIEDISERKRAEEELLRSGQKYRALVEGHADVIFSMDTNGRVEYISPTIARFTGRSREEMEGRSIFDFLAPPEREAFSGHMRRTMTAGSAVGEYPIAAQDGTTRWIRASSSVREEAGRVSGIHGILSDITELRIGEQALRESEEQFRTLYENSPLGLYRTSPDGRVLMANPTLVSMLGFSSFAELAGRDLERNGFASATDRGQFMDKIERDGTVSGLESVWKRRDGTEIIVRESARAVRDEAGRTRFFDGIVEDVTDLKRTEKLMATLYGISQAVHSSPDLPVLYGRIHELIAGIVNAGNFFIALLSADDSLLEFPYYRDEKDRNGSPIRADDPQSLTSEVLRTRQPLLLDEAQLAERYATGASRVWGTMPKCWLGIPLMSRDRIIGVMALQDYRDGRAYGPGEMALMEATAGQIAVTIERKRTEDALRASEEAFKGYFNISTVGMAVTSPAKGWIEVNDCLCRMLGYTREELAGLPWSRLTHPEDLDADVELFNETVAGRRDSYELDKRFIRKDGQVVHTRLAVTCQRDSGGQVRHFLASLVDISERKRAEEALRRSEATQAAALQMTKAGHWEYDVERDLFTFNDNFYRIFRTTADAVGGYQMSSAEYARRFCHPEDMSMVAEETRKAMEASDPGFHRQLEHRILYANGQTGIISVRIFIIKDDRGRTVKTYGVNQDITELKWAESEIKRQLEEKSVLLKEVHHRIKNNFASVAGLLALQAQEAPPEVSAALREAGSRVESMRLLYDKLLLREDYKEVAAKEYMESLAAAVIGQFRGEARIDLELDVADFPIPAKRLFPLGIILNELLTNAMKHAFAGRKSGRIRLSLARTAGRANLVLEDNGAGLPEGFDPEKAQGFGLMLVRMLSKQLGGTFAMASGKKGTRSEIAFDAG